MKTNKLLLGVVIGIALTLLVAADFNRRKEVGHLVIIRDQQGYGAIVDLSTGKAKRISYTTSTPPRIPLMLSENWGGRNGRVK